MTRWASIWTMPNTASPKSEGDMYYDWFFMVIISNCHLMGYLKVIISKLFFNGHYHDHIDDINGLRDSH